jgi:hypothetical protein
MLRFPPSIRDTRQVIYTNLNKEADQPIKPYREF